MAMMKRIAFIWAMLAVGSTMYTSTSSPGIMETLQQIQNEMQKLTQFKDSVTETMTGLARQVMQQQMFVEERIRSDGSSGVKQVRATAGGTRPYYTSSTSAFAVNSIHEHSNYDRTVGMGEFIGVLNGVEFRTRHNDYKLVMPSTTSKDYDATEPIPMPEVPPSVLEKESVDDQIDEMRQYFKAFQKQDPTIRDYEPYFKPVMCYLEGGWTTDTQTLTEPFQSDRHFIDATSWFDLQQKVQYTAASGGKSQLENFSYLPTTIINVTADGKPVYAQWNYRILCHPIKTAIKLHDFKVIDDLAGRMLLKKNFTAFSNTKAARFGVAPYFSYWNKAMPGYGYYNEKRYTYGRMDSIMYEIPGKNNYVGNLTDEAFGLPKYHVNYSNATILNVARYHRFFRVLNKGAMGLSIRNRGFSDPNLFVAKTTNPHIAKFATDHCKGRGKNEECSHLEAAHTYAVPLEIIYLTPLQTWNPYHVEFYTKSAIPKSNGRNGAFTQGKAYNGSSSSYFYRTPKEFYEGGETKRDPADTARDNVGVLDKNGTIRAMAGSGIRIFTPEIPGVGTVRLRYPVMPFHEEGSVSHKHLMALQDITMDMKKFTHMFERRPELADPNARTPDVRYVTSEARADPPGPHVHEMYVTQEQIIALKTPGKTISVYTTEANGHQHELVLAMADENPNLYRLAIIRCDGDEQCWDLHNRYVKRN